MVLRRALRRRARPADCLAFARFCGRFDKLRRSTAWSTARPALTELLSRLEGLFDKIARRRPGEPVGQVVYVAGDWSRAIQTGRLRNYLMFLAVALVGLFAGVFAWVRG